ncbi:histidinol-phosphatase (PHP family) [Anaerovirgula multivorans]|uniref:Histidinol-phosphatase n=1 Tax=Anaerovirgula multivorans TaxID=312168 RepID=A0A239HYY9_9FIRM|nr:histidinol-phosphatase HisJ family protein [Anaerovirgula multivorans]SNS86570.1 histidinol-phosphatase (PHP family) [Anaerovirgula multivorans]
MYDFHVHSSYSPDASMTMEEAVLSAIKNGIKEICFTDHIDYDYPECDLSFEFSYKDYFDAIELYKKKYEDKIVIRKGIEMGLQPHILDKCSTDIVKHNFDFVIASIHVVEKKDLYAGDFFHTKTQKSAYETYFEELNYIINNYQDYNVIGHFDIIKRYGGFETSLPLQEYKEHTNRILKKIIENGKGIELNTSGIRYGLEDYHPSIEIIELYYKLGGEIITLGSDAHVPQHVAFNFSHALKQLKDIGFKYITSFNKMEPSFHKIDDLL